MSAPGALPVDCVPGGATRDASVRAGLAVLPPEIDRVLIHDAARPLVTTALVERVLVAGDPEFDTEVDRQKRGIPLHTTQYEAIIATARRVGAQILI